VASTQRKILRLRRANRFALGLAALRMTEEASLLDLAVEVGIGVLRLCLANRFALGLASLRMTMVKGSGDGDSRS
jgi:hypothetical protein